jgi:hypothetical protein
MGPFPPEEQKPPTGWQLWFHRLTQAWWEVPIATGKVVSGTAELATVVPTVVTGEIKEVAKATSNVIQETKSAADTVIQSSAGTVAEAGKAGEGVASLLQKIPEIGEKVASEMADPTKLIEAAKKGLPNSNDPRPLVNNATSAATSAATAAVIKGGALISESPSVSTAVLLFSIGLLAFSGFVFYTMRNTYAKPEKSDDPPGEPRTVRGSSESSKQGE